MGRSAASPNGLPQPCTPLHRGGRAPVSMRATIIGAPIPSAVIEAARSQTYGATGQREYDSRAI